MTSNYMNTPTLGELFLFSVLKPIGPLGAWWDVARKIGAPKRRRPSKPKKKKGPRHGNR